MTPLIATEPFEDSVTFSPDGRWVALESNEVGQPEVYALHYPLQEGEGGRRLTGGAGRTRDTGWVR